MQINCLQARLVICYQFKIRSIMQIQNTWSSSIIALHVPFKNNEMHDAFDWDLFFRFNKKLLFMASDIIENYVPFCPMDVRMHHSSYALNSK